MSDVVASQLEDGQRETLGGVGPRGPVVVPARLQRVNPVPGMMIDVNTWRDAHEYHRNHARLHHLVLHGWGIVTGLEVHVGQSANALLIQPGVAVDPTGNFIIVDQEQVHRISLKTPGMLYLALRFREAPVEPGSHAAGPPSRVLEGFAVEERTLPPTDNDLELARIDFDPQSAPIRPAGDPQKPGRNELDLRWRTHRGPAGQSVPTASSSAGLATDVREQLNLLVRRVQELGDQVPTKATLDQMTGPQVAAIQQRVADIARQVEALRQQRPARPTTDAAEVSVPDWQVVELRERLDGLAQRVEETDERVQQLRQEREDLSRERQALAEQVSSLGTPDENRASDLEPLRERLEQLSLELERLVTSVEPLQQRVSELAERSEAPALPTWEAAAASPAAGPELRLALGRHASAGWDQHGEGLRLLVRELGATSEWSATMLDPVGLADVGPLELLYITGYAAIAFDEAEVQGIGRVLESGGVVLAEGCAAGPSGEAGAREFAFSFIELAQRFGRRLARVERRNALLEACYVFGEPPAGARPPRVLEGDGMIYSDADYGCAWQGGSRDQVLSRTAIRDAIEFGVNLALYRRQTRG